MPSRPPLIGREREIEILGRLLRRAREGSGAVALIEGEPGIGKTRMLHETLERAAQLGFAALAGTADELARDQPFGSLVPALDLRPRAPDPRRASIGRLLIAGGVGAHPVATGPALRYQVLDAILDLVEAISSEKPLILALDDAQWADASTLLVLRDLVARLAPLRIVLLLAARPTERTSELAGVIEGLRAAGLIELGLRPLSSDEVVVLARAAMATAGPDLLARLSGAAGNPLLVTEFISAVRDIPAGSEHATAHPGIIDVPATFTDAVLRRLRYLSAGALHVIRVASALGTSFSVADLTAVLDRPVTDLLPLLDEARVARLFVEIDDRLAFRHDLVRDAVYGDLPTATRGELHMHVARTLAKAGRSAAQVAAHLMRGATPGDEEAIRWLHRAANETIDLDPAAAREMLERARGLSSPTLARPELLTDLLRAYVWSGRVKDAEALGALLLATNDADHELVRLFVARALLSQGRGPEALTMLEPALLDESDGGSARTALITVGAILRVMVGDPGGARALAERGVAVARAAGSIGDEALNLAYRGMAARGSGDPRTAVEYARLAVAVAERSKSALPEFVPVYNLAGRLFIDADRMDEAEIVLQNGRILTEEHGFAWGQAECHALSAERLFDIGQWDDALAEAETAVTLCKRYGAWHAFAIAKTIEALVAIRRNDLEGAATHVAAAREVLASAPGVFGRPWVWWASGLRQVADGDDEAALRSLLTAWDDSGGIASEQTTIGPDIVRVAIRLEKTDVAVDVARTLRSLADRAGLPRIDGAAHVSQGVLHGDIDALSAGLAAYRTIGRPYELAEALEGTALAQASAGIREAAVANLRESIEIRERLGAARDVARLEATLRSLGVRRGRRSARRRPQTGWRSLTSTEESVARLVADGLRNREIADRLFVSPRTVETHLTHVFGKLGISSRTELVAIARREAT